MSQSIIQRLEKFLGSNISKTLVTLVVIIFTAGVMYEKLSYAVVNMPKQIAAEMIKQLTDLEKKVDVIETNARHHEVVDNIEKQVINEKISELKNALNRMQERQDGYAQKTFIRPSSPSIEETKRRYR